MQRETWQTILKNCQSRVWCEPPAPRHRRWYVGIEAPSGVCGIQPTQSPAGSEPLS